MNSMLLLALVLIVGVGLRASYVIDVDLGEQRCSQTGGQRLRVFRASRYRRKKSPRSARQSMR